MEQSRSEMKKNNESAGKHYTDEKFWGKLKKFAIMSYRQRKKSVVD